nr:MAG TPA: hypothetical protein [Caudoviricetes sp.]
MFLHTHPFDLQVQLFSLYPPFFSLSKTTY